MAKWRKDPVIAYGVPQVGGFMGYLTDATVYWVNGTTGSDAKNGRSYIHPMKTITGALARMVDGDILFIAPGTYAEAVTVPVTLDGCKFIGLPGAKVNVQPSATNADALTVIGNDHTFENMVFTGKGTGSAVVNYGNDVTFRKCEITGGTIGLKAFMATSAQDTAGTHNLGRDLRVLDCEIGGNTTGVTLNATDYGALDRPHFIGCWFHDNTAADFEEAGGTASDRWDGLYIHQCRFSRVLAGTEPTAYLALNDDNGNSGIVSQCVFPTALAGGKNLVSTLCLWVSNYHTGGISNAQPS